jgi:choline monooxygenase
MLNFYPWGLSVNLVEPIGPARTRVRFRTYVRDRALLGQGAGGALDEVEMEDEAVVQTVQRGLRSRFYSKGRYSPSREQGVHHFHRLIGEFLREPQRGLASASYLSDAGSASCSNDAVDAAGQE